MYITKIITLTRHQHITGYSAPGKSYRDVRRCEW